VRVQGNETAKGGKDDDYLKTEYLLPALARIETHVTIQQTCASLWKKTDTCRDSWQGPAFYPLRSTQIFSASYASTET